MSPCLHPRLRSEPPPPPAPIEASEARTQEELEATVRGTEGGRPDRSRPSTAELAFSSLSLFVAITLFVFLVSPDGRVAPTQLLANAFLVA